jgi:hypothetical protein
MLLVGVPKEIKDNEYRVGIVLSTVPNSDCVAAPPPRWFFASADWPVRLGFPTMSIATDIRSNNDVNGGP